VNGRPITEWIIFALLWTIFLIPLTQLTRQPLTAMHPAESMSQAAEDKVATWATLRFSHRPRSFVLRQQERVLWQQENPDDQFLEKEVWLSVNEQQSELTLEIHWHGDERLKAAEITLEPDARHRQSRTFWHEEELEADIMRFQWQ
jgi:hypothetical protein